MTARTERCCRDTRKGSRDIAGARFRGLLAVGDRVGSTDGGYASPLSSAIASAYETDPDSSRRARRGAFRQAESTPASLRKPAVDQQSVKRWWLAALGVATNNNGWSVARPPASSSQRLILKSGLASSQFLSMSWRSGTTARTSRRFLVRPRSVLARCEQRG